MQNGPKNINVFMHTISLDNIEESFADQVQYVDLFKLQLDEYSQRALLMAGSDDYIILNSYPERDYLNFLLQMGMGSANILVPQNSEGPLSSKVIRDNKLIDTLKGLNSENGRVILQPYISTEIEWEIAAKINGTISGSDPGITKKTNSKIYFREMLRELGIPATQCAIADNNNVVKVAGDAMERHKEIVVKGDLSCGGSAVWAIRNNGDFNKFRNQALRRKDNNAYLVEKMYELKTSPNIQVEIFADRINEVAITDQELDNGLNHHGNSYPSRSGKIEKIQEYSGKISRKLQLLGYRGLIGMDFIETTDGGLFPLEINARANTSSFAIKAIQKMLPTTYHKKRFRIIISLQVGGNITFRKLKNLIKEENIFNKKSGCGILPYNVGCLEWGKFDALVVADTDDDVRRLLDVLHNLFPLAN